MLVMLSEGNRGSSCNRAKTAGPRKKPIVATRVLMVTSHEGHYGKGKTEKEEYS
jgi:hypothetical protein